MLSKEVPLEEIIDFLGDNVIGVYGNITDVLIDNIGSSDKITEFSLDWVNPIRENKQQIAENSKAKAIITDSSVRYTNKMKQAGKVQIIVQSPRSEVCAIGNYFFIPKIVPSIHSSAVISEQAVIGKSVFIGANTLIGDCVIGDGCSIMPNVCIHDGVELGNDVIVQSGAVLGTDGLGCSRDNDGRLTKFPHLGGLKICDKVEIGANCSVARGSFQDTIIGEGTKINSLCFIAHNCVLGKNVLITGSSMLNGSVHIGDDSTIYSKVIIRDQIVIGKKVVIGMGSVVTKNIPDNETWVGNPARKLEKK